VKTRAVTITVSASSVLAWLLLVALWVRSYWTADMVRYRGSRSAGVVSMKGQIRMSASATSWKGVPTWQWDSQPTGSMMPDGMGSSYFRVDRQSMFVVFPHRLVIMLLALLAVAPWIRWRFSLRTVLISTALVALVLGLAVFFGR
jgi:hypothetical protein